MNNYANILNKMLSNNQIIGNPIVQNAVNMGKNNNISGLQQLANNIAKEKGTTVEEFRKQIGI